MTSQINDTKKELILQTASELLAKNGFAKTTLEDIANALGMKKSSLYYYYSNKDALFEDVMELEEKSFCFVLKNALGKSGTAIDKIINYEKAKFEYIKEKLKLHENTTNIILELKGKMFEHIKSIQKEETEMLKQILDDSVKKNEIKRCDTKMVAELILTLSEALRYREFYFASFTVSKSVDFTKAINEMMFAIKLIFDGLSINQ